MSDLRDRASAALTAWNEARAAEAREEAEAEAEKRRLALDKLLQRVLGLPANSRRLFGHEEGAPATYTEDGLVFSCTSGGWSSEYGTSHPRLLLKGECPKCGEGAWATVDTLSTVAELTEQFVPAYWHECERAASSAPVLEPTAAEALAALILRIVRQGSEA